MQASLQSSPGLPPVTLAAAMTISLSLLGFMWASLGVKWNFTVELVSSSVVSMHMCGAGKSAQQPWATPSSPGCSHNDISVVYSGQLVLTRGP